MRRIYALFAVGLLLAATIEARSEEQPALVRMVFVGDIMLDQTPGEVVANGDDPFEHCAALLDDADLTVGNLECVIAAGGQAEDKKYTFRAHPRCVAPLGRHFDALSIANNHAGDFGKDAVVEMLQHLSDGELPYFGGGRNAEEAHRPLILERKGIRIALLGYNEFKPRSFEAGPDTPGLAWSGGQDDQVVADIKAARKQHKADVVIPFMHWGWEYEPAPDDRQRELARKMIDAGADVVIGAHPHVTQGAEQDRGRPIVYSLGNFLFNGFEDEVSRTGWLLRLTVSKTGVQQWDTRVVLLDEQGLPHPVPGVASPCGQAGDEEIGSCKTE